MSVVAQIPSAAELFDMLERLMKHHRVVVEAYSSVDRADTTAVACSCSQSV